MSTNADPPAADGPDADELVADLRDAHADLRDVDHEIADIGEDSVERVADAYREATGLLDEYAESATGTGDFQAYVEFQERFASLVEGLPEDLRERDAFETALETIDKRRLSESDFASAHETLAPVADLARLPEERADARDAYREARRAVERRLSAIDDREADLERLLELGDADLDAPTDRLRDPIEAYNDAVRAAFRDFRANASAREVLGWAESATWFPLAGVREPADDLLAYVREYDTGTAPVPKLLEYVDYSQSKLDHYVDDPAALRRHVATRQTYLERLDADPLTVDWPPAPADELRYRCRDLLSVVARFADGEYDAVERLRSVRALTTDDDYERLRTAAVAREQLGPEERDRLAGGDVERELAALRDERERLRDALDEYERTA